MNKSMQINNDNAPRSRRPRSFNRRANRGDNGLIDELIDRINGIILAAERGRTAVAQASIV